MILGIDASNIRSGGGLTHLKEIIKCGDPQKFGFSKVIIWSNDVTLNELPNNDWLVKRSHILLNKSSILSFIFQLFFITKFLNNDKIDLLFVPGGTFLGSFRPFVSMSQNMLPFEKEEQNRFSNWKTRLRFKILHFTQSQTFKKSKAVIFLTLYAKDFITQDIKLKNRFEIIPHGINLNFLNQPKSHRQINTYSSDNPFKFLYVSVVTVYKHQWNVAEAVIRLRNEGYPIQLDLVGSYSKESLAKLNYVKSKDLNEIINYRGLMKYEDLEFVYKKADGFIFASSCENMPIILIEAMSAGLPIASSNMGPMPEVLKEGGFYFNPLDVDSIYLALKDMLDNENLREKKSSISYNNSISYTWKECSDKTFQFLSNIAKQS